MDNKLINMYRILNLVKYNFTTKKSIAKNIKILFKEILKQNFIFDRVLIISIFQKMFSNKDADDIIFKNIIKKWK
jgi:hypothetical protein